MDKRNSNGSQSVELREEGPKIQNVVATVILKNQVKDQEQCKLDLETIQKQMLNCQYNKKRFPAIIVRKKDPKTTGLIFSSGKLIIIGGKSKENCQASAKAIKDDLNKILSKGNIKITFDEDKDVHIRNMVANCSLGYKISLETLNFEKRVEAEKTDKFPGVIYKVKLKPRKKNEHQENTKKKNKNKNEQQDPNKPPETSIVALIFTSGKIVFTGAESKEEIDEAWEQMKILLPQYRQVDQ